jgi:Uma2 family endonuclease
MVQQLSTPSSDPKPRDIPAPDITDLIIEDDQPVDNFQSEKQQRLLVETLYASKPLPPPFIAAANVGLFYATKTEGIAPDMFLSLAVQMPDSWVEKQNRSYLFWEFGKAPEVAIEIVSNRRGSELGSKKLDYARMGIAYYVVFDALQQIQEPEQMDGQLLRTYALTAGRYVELAAPFLLETVGLGLTLWEGDYEEAAGLWLRWTDLNGRLIPTGAERADQAEARAERAEIERQQAEIERQQAEIERQQAEIERQQAEIERQQAKTELQQAEAKAQALADRLRALGIDPDQL